jgi:DNA-binding LacI/PurR family transcriptional regulator
LRNRLRNRLRTVDQAPTKRPRLTDVADRARVSTSTASRALNGVGELSDQTRESVRRAAEELGFRPSPTARSLRTRRTQTVGLVVPHVTHAFYAAVITGAQATLEEHGYRLILINSGEEADPVSNALRTLLDHEVDGLLVSTTPFAAERFNELLQDTPCVFLDELAPGAGHGNVVLENGKGVRMLVEHLVGHGHSRIGFLGGPEDRTSGRERLGGFLDAMAHHALPVHGQLVRACEWTIYSGFREGGALLEVAPRPTAVVAASAELALGMLAAARGASAAIPDELALVSFDDRYFAPLLEPALTAIAYDAGSVGSEGAQLLVDAMAGIEPRRTEARVDVSLVRRRSCGCEYDPASDLAGVIE